MISVGFGVVPLRKRRVATLGFLVASALVAMCAAAPTPSSATQEVTTASSKHSAAVETLPLAVGNAAYTVVSVGDSYASGEGAKGRRWLDPTCHRSKLAAANQTFNVQTALMPGAKTKFDFLACSGSVTKRDSGGRRSLLGPDGQLARLPGGRIDALIVSIGGNDLDFAPIAIDCANPFLWWGCSSDPYVRARLKARLQLLPQKLDNVLSAVPKRVRHVYLTEYPDPTTGIFGIHCGYPLAESFQGLDFITGWESQWAAENIVKPLNSSLRNAIIRANRKAVAVDTKFHYVGGIAKAFFAHGPCTGGGHPNLAAWFNPRYIGTIVDSLTSQGDAMGAMHPNDIGQQVIRDHLLRSMAPLFAEPYMFIEPPRYNYTFVVGVETSFNIHVKQRNGFGIPNAQVFIDGQPAGTTNAAGFLPVTHTFSSEGQHLISARAQLPNGKQYVVQYEVTAIILN